MNLDMRLRQHTGLTPTDQCLRDYILRYPEKLARMNSRQLAEATYTSPAAVVRFCKKFGYQGLQEFKKDFFSQIPDAPAFDLPDGNFPFEKQTDTETLVRSILKLEEGTLRRLGAILDARTLDHAAEMLQEADVIDLCAIGTGRYLLEELQFRLTKFGFHAVQITNSVDLSYLGSRMDEKHCMLILSYSGMSEQIGNAIRSAKEHKTPIILITSRTDGQAARMADCVLPIPPLESWDEKISTFSSAVAEKAILDLLYAKLFQTDYDANTAFVKEDAVRLETRRPMTFRSALEHGSKKR